MNTQTTAKRLAFVAINDYRSSTSSGFGNTWRVYSCSPETRKRLLEEGLPVTDSCYLHNDGTRSPILSTMGIRPATAAERREWHRANQNGEAQTI